MDAPTTPPDQPRLNKAISRRLLLLFVIGDVVGGGIYTLVGNIGAEVGGVVWLQTSEAVSGSQKANQQNRSARIVRGFMSRVW
jgi:hypothetical protein